MTNDQTSRMGSSCDQLLAKVTPISLTNRSHKLAAQFFFKCWQELFVSKMIRHCPTTPWHRQAATKRRLGHQQADWGHRSGTLFAGCCVPGARREGGAFQWQQHADAAHDKTASLRDWCTAGIRNYPYEGRIPHRISRWSNPVSNIEG